MFAVVFLWQLNEYIFWKLFSLTTNFLRSILPNFELSKKKIYRNWMRQVWAKAEARGERAKISLPVAARNTERDWILVPAIARVSLTRMGCNAIRERANAVCITRTFALCVLAIRRFQRRLWLYRALTVKPSGLQAVTSSHLCTCPSRLYSIRRHFNIAYNNLLFTYLLKHF